MTFESHNPVAIANMTTVDFQSVRRALRVEHRVMDTPECSDHRRCYRPFTNQVERRQ
jgi:hypothetical protein